MANKNKRKNTRKLPDSLVNCRPIEWRWMPYELAKQYARMTGIKTFRQYRHWIINCKPGGMPSTPPEAYIEWTSWTDFLGTNNVYLADLPNAVRRTQLLPYWEAVASVHKLGLKTIAEFNVAYDNGKIAEGIPRHPGRRYHNFKKNGGWPSFLGKNVQSKITAAKQITPIFVLYKKNHRSANILSVLIHKSGQTDLKTIISEQQLGIIQWYEWNEEYSGIIFELLNQHGTRQDETSWLFHNVNALFFDIAQYLDRWEPTES